MSFNLLLIVSFADLWITLHYNPSLSSEANPLVASFGLAQAGLIFSNVLILALLGLALVIYQFGSRAIPPIPSSEPWEYFGISLYQKKMTRAELWRAFLPCWPLPSNWNQFFRYAGVLTVWTFIAARISAVMAWVLIYKLDWTWYDHFRGITAVAGYPCLELLIGLIVGALLFRPLVRHEFQMDHPQPPRAQAAPAAEQP